MTNSGRKGKRNAASADRRRIRDLEDVTAVLLDVSLPLKVANEARKTIKRQAWETSDPVIYRASQQQKAALEQALAALERLKAALSERWHYLMDDLKEDTN